MELVAIKIKIGLKNEGGAKYPDFNSLQCVKDKGMDWSRYVDIYGLGWFYDKTSGHREASVNSEYGNQDGCLTVPAEFAEQAIAMFPEVTELTETEFEDFHDNKATAHMPDETINKDVLDGIKAKQDLGLDLTADQLKAIDPADSKEGIKKNNMKKWTNRKVVQDVTIKNTKNFIKE